MRRHPIAALASLLPAAGLILLAHATPARADAASDIGGAATTSTNGQVIYQQVCQACHMANAKGATGAATIPALADNAKLKSSGYPVYMVLNGRGGMPWLSNILTDTQVASVVNYVRSHFGNDYTDTVKPEDVAAVRGPAPVVE